MNHREMKQLAFQTQLKVLGQSDKYPHGALTGYGAYFNNIDSGGDVILPGAFAKTIKENLSASRIKLVGGHDTYGGTDGIIGVITHAVEDSKGLRITAQFSSTARAQDVRTKVKEGVLDALSIGYFSTKDRQLDTYRELQELKLFEISVVAWPMNDKSRISEAKSDTEVTAMLRKMTATFRTANIKSTAVLMQGK